jgi:transketolase
MDLEPFTDKWKSFGWDTSLVQDGHDIKELSDALEHSINSGIGSGKPRVIIANTVKGKCISFMEKNAINWHAGHLDEKLYNQCKKELGL